MTPPDRVAFAQAFNRLAVATRLPAGEADAAMQEVYWRGLEDMVVADVVAAAERLSRTAEWFPKVSEWRQVAYRHRLDSVLRLPASREEPWHHECAACEDSGWEPRRCYPGTLNTCGRRLCGRGGEQAREHGYVVECPCRPTNRTYQRARAVISGKAS